MAKDTYKKRMRASWNSGKACKGDGHERVYARAEVRQFLKEMDEDYQAPYKKAKRKRNDKARLEHRIRFAEEALARHKHSDGFSRWIRADLAAAKKLYTQKYGKNPTALDAPYWICNACANERDGVYFKGCSTAADMTCGYCNGTKQVKGEFCFPVVDYKWPKTDGK